MTDPLPVQFMAFIVIILILVIWETVWKLVGLWKAGRNNQLGWFIVMGLVNSVGIIPIVYITFFQNKPVRREMTSSRRIRR